MHDSLDITATRLHNNLTLQDQLDKARTGYASLNGGRLSPLDLKGPRMQVNIIWIDIISGIYGFGTAESVMCDVIKIRFKRNEERRSGKGKL